MIRKNVKNLFLLLLLFLFYSYETFIAYVQINYIINLSEINLRILSVHVSTIFYVHTIF